MITYVGHGFSIAVPGEWARLATGQHLAVFLGREVEGVRSSITLSRYPGSARAAAHLALADHRGRFDGYEVLHESSGADAFYRRFRWGPPGGSGVVQHQLFTAGLVVTCSRSERQAIADDERAFAAAMRSLRVEVGGIGSPREDQTR